MRNYILTAVIAGTLTLTPAFAGTAKKGDCPITKAKKAVVHVADSAQDSVADAALAAKKKITGDQKSTFVQGHYTQNGSHVKGHYRKLVNPVNGPSIAAKAKKAVVKAGDAVQNAVADTGIAAKKKISGHAHHTFVKGHYTQSGSHVKGHYRHTN